MDFYPMTKESAAVIAHEWKYDPPFDFYDMTADPDDFEEFMTPELWPEIFYEVWENGELVGFFSGEWEENQSTVEIGLDLRPDYAGHGLGQ